MILFIKHIEIEGPETLGTFLKEQGFSIDIIDLSKGDSLPQDVAALQAVVSLGGPMNVYEEEKFAFLKEENVFIKKILDKEVPFLGICLGSQLLAKAADAKVVKSPNKEIGFSKVQFTEKGKCDNLFSGVSSDLLVYQWHEDMFEIPKDGTKLAFSEKCPNQAFKIGSCAYGLQFHVEITEKSIRDWADAYFDKENIVLQQKKTEMLKGYSLNKGAFDKTARVLFKNFCKLTERKKHA